MLAFLTRRPDDILLYLLCHTRCRFVDCGDTRLLCICESETRKNISWHAHSECGNVTTINLGWKNNAFPWRVLYKYLRQLCVRWTLQINRLTRMNHIFRSFAIADGGRYRSVCICLCMCLHNKKKINTSRSSRCNSRVRFAFSARTISQVSNIWDKQ